MKHFLAHLVSLLFASLLLSSVVHAAPAMVRIVELISPEGRASLLIGTLHMVPPGVQQAAPDLIAQRRKLFLESDLLRSAPPEQNDRFPGLADDSEFAPWAAELSAAERQKLQDRMTCVGIHLNINWLFSRQTSRRASGLAWLPGCQALLTYYRPDKAFQVAALELNVQVGYLDTPDQLAKSYSRIPPEVYLDFLKAGLAAGNLEQQYVQTAEAINRGDFDDVEKLTSPTFLVREHADVYRREILTKRNEAWVETLLPELEQGDVVVVVGAAHIPGPTGLLSLLARKGYTYNLVNTPARCPGPKC